MRTKPWMVINLLTNATLGWYASDIEAWDAHRGQPVDVQYRPGRKAKVKRN